MSDEQKIKAVDNSHCMKTEKECMAASAPTLGTFDIINSIDLESIISRVSSKTLNLQDKIDVQGGNFLENWFGHVDS